MSLIHSGYPQAPSDDPADGSYLKGVIKNPKLITLLSEEASWGTNLLDYIWGTQASNITTFIVGGSGDTFECEHLIDVY